MDGTKYLAISSAVVFLLTVLSLSLGNKILTFNILAWGIVAVAVPTMYFNYMEYRRIREIEDMLPVFLRDLSESIHSGMSMIEGLSHVSSNDYGPLTAEIRRITNAVKWGVPLESALQKAAARLSASDKAYKVFTILRQANKSGGEVYKILFSLARDVQKLKEIESERSTEMGRHVMMVYAIFVIFVGISIILLRFLNPIITQMGSGFSAGNIRFGQDPCQMGGGGLVKTFACMVFKGTVVSLGLGTAGTMAYYKGLMFWMIIVQGMFSGFVAGFIESSSIANSLRHSITMALMGFLAFYVSCLMGVI